MYQPFERFHSQYIPRLIGLKKKYLVSQTYNRAFDHFSNDSKTNILLTDYEDIVEAQKHFYHVKGDKFASIIHLGNEKHQQKLNEMLSEDSKYCVYWAIVKDAKQTMKNLEIKYKDHVRRYVATKTNLNPKARETLSTSLVVSFGEIYLVIKAGNNPITVNFEEIEKS